MFVATSRDWSKLPERNVADLAPTELERLKPLIYKHSVHTELRSFSILKRSLSSPHSSLLPNFYAEAQR